MATHQASLTPSSDTPNVRKRGRTACTRYKNRKQKCDDKLPVCSNCQRAGTNCDKLDMSNDSPATMYTRALEDRITFLESSLRDLRRDQLSRTQPLSDTSRSSVHVEAEPHPGALDDVVTLMSFAASESATHVGPSQGLSLNMILDEMVQATVWNKSLADVPSVNASKRYTMAGPVQPVTVEELMAKRVKEPPSDELGSKLIRAYITQLHSRYPFLDTRELWELHHDGVVSATLRSEAMTREQRFGIFKLYLVYAIGATLLQLTEKAACSPESFYMTALQHISAARESRTTHNIEAMTLLVVYHLRSTSSHGIWYMIGLAMRTCIDLGMHRKANERGLSGDDVDRRRRLFWTVYYLERMIAISLGRPLSISDRQIDVPLPDSDGSREGTPKSAALALHLFRLRRIESHIYDSIYRADRPLTSLLVKLDPLFRDLESWRSSLIADFADSSPPELNYPLLHYNRAVRLLIQPFLPLLSLSDNYHKLCLRAAGDICQAHKRLHQSLDYGHSFIAVQTVFVAGLTLLYGLWRWNQDAWSVALADDIRACSLVLFVMSERAPWVQRYRDAFEMLISAAMAKLQTGSSSAGVAEMQSALFQQGCDMGYRREEHTPRANAEHSAKSRSSGSNHPSFEPDNSPGMSEQGVRGPIDDGSFTAWPIVAELVEWMEQDGGSPVLWMPEFERLHNLPDIGNSG
ncbi:hypothetical protein CONLIGDRAFT_624528 [Coniochaeta ligniaria NRRL 30616]|uniref:Zn(2)-C6 fungal-type domain-containing protein n=1 Tax=Coniochaeta ligniaria NRRL 30616 TaxID=1408157 RepID=A0A1J7I7M6_9PEZI|nr:hypothetical protein CONLIGDRAFT_624528 [Coniochaeta ligniaria NRRL 30616]